MKRAGVGIGVLALLSIAASCKSKSSSSTPPPDLGDPSDFVASIVSNGPCALACTPGCAEATAPWVCPALADWGAIPHADTCTGDGVTMPAVHPGACVASDPAGDALTPVTRTAPIVLPDGRRLAPAGSEWVFHEPDIKGGFPASAMLLPGTKWLVVTDTADGVESLRVLDTTVLKAGASTTPVASYVPLPSPHGTSYGMAWRASTSTLYVGGGQADARLVAYDLDAASGALTEDDAKSIGLTPQAFVQSVAISPDGKTLLAGLVSDGHVLVLDPDHPQAAAQTIDLGAPDPFTLRFDPNDPTGHTAWATMWTFQNPSAPDTMRIARLDVASKSVVTMDAPKAPEEIAFVSARWAVVASGLGDALSVVDLAAGAVASTYPIGDLHGSEPTVLAWDAARSRLYATLASRNAVAAFHVDTTQTPPAITPVGAFPTGWWPTSVVVDPADGTVYVVNGKGHGSSQDAVPPSGAQLYGSDISDEMAGSVQAVPAMDDGALAAGQKTVDAQNDVEAVAGYSTVNCNGAAYDFPIPAKTTDGPSAQITHVVFVVRENKTFDAIFGDAAQDGDPQFVMAPGHQDEIWPNARALAKAFAHMTNFYEDAELSVQGHTWASFGRSTDYDERRWPFAGGSRATLGVSYTTGVSPSTNPVEGSIFTSVGDAGRSIENGGEFVGGFDVRDFTWPGGTPNSHIPDTIPGCWLAGRARATCDLPDFTFAWLPNDHTNGLAPGWPNPAAMIATNDEATGMVVEGISRSPYWPTTLVIVVEDDPQDGSDHVDHHRSIALFASPWVKRGYASRAHYDMASVHKLLAHVYGTPYRNQEIADAPLPWDLFTSTPDYTPFTHVPRKWTDIGCNPGGTSEAALAERWDFTHPDEQPGLSAQVARYLRALPR